MLRRVLRPDPILEHAQTEGAGGAHHAGFHAQRLFGALDIHPLADPFLEPHHAAACTAAEALLPAALHLPGLDARQEPEDLPGRIEDPIVSPQVARIVIGDGLPDRRPRFHPALPQEVADEHRVVDDLVVSAELPVFVLERVEAVGAGGDDLLHAVAVEGLDVGLRLHLEQELVPDAPGDIAGAALFLAQDGKVHPGGLQHLHKRPGDLLGALVKGRSAPHPVQVLRRPSLCYQGDAQTLGPRRSAWHGALVRVAAGLHPSHGRLHRLGESRLLHNQEAAHVDDLGDRLDEDRAFVVARATRRAGPDHVLADHAPHHGLPVAAPARLGQQVVAQVNDEPFRRERLPRGPGGAGVLASAALRAGHEIQQVLAGKSLDRRDAEVLCFFQNHRLDHARGLRPAQRDVGRRREDVADQGVRHQRDEGEGQDRMPPPGHPVQQGLLGSRQPCETKARHPSSWRPETPGVPGGRDSQPLDNEPADQDAEKQPQEEAVPLGVARLP